MSAASLAGFRGMYPRQHLARFTRLGIGGAADWYFVPESLGDFKQFLISKPAEMEVTSIGLGSNLLVRDAGVSGTVVRLDQACRELVIHGNCVTVGAGVSMRKLSHHAASHGLTGFEFLHGIPGHIGGAVAMNAGAFGRAMADVVSEVCFLDDVGCFHSARVAELRFGYRTSHIPKGWTVVRATLCGEHGKTIDVRDRMEEMERARRAYQPVGGRTAGSTFKNPTNGHARILIAEAGCSGLRIGDAWVSDLNPNFFFNLGAARSGEIELLIETVKSRVQERCSVQLELELRIIGRETDGPLENQTERRSQ